jgi:hypothetical protein
VLLFFACEAYEFVHHAIFVWWCNSTPVPVGRLVFLGCWLLLLKFKDVGRPDVSPCRSAHAFALSDTAVAERFITAPVRLCLETPGGRNSFQTSRGKQIHLLQFTKRLSATVLCIPSTVLQASPSLVYSGLQQLDTPHLVDQLLLLPDHFFSHTAPSCIHGHFSARSEVHSER